MNIIFIRHSKTFIEPEKSITLWGLSDKGIELANALSKTESIKSLQVIYTSLQTKALETALYLAKPNGIPIRANNDFTEITSFTNRFIANKKDYEKNIFDFYHDNIRNIEYGETYDESLERFNKALEQILVDEERNGIDDIGIVSHGNILAYFTAQYSNKSSYELHELIQMPDYAIFDWKTKKFIKFWGD